MTIQDLMKARHAAYQTAKANEFRHAPSLQAWREANRRYVLARDETALPTAQRANRAA